MCFENNFEDAARRKTAKYTDLVDQACTNGYNATLLTLVGSRGVPHYENFVKLATVLHMPARDLMNLLRNVMSTVPSLALLLSGVPGTDCHSYMSFVVVVFFYTFFSSSFLFVSYGNLAILLLISFLLWYQVIV